MCFQQPPKEFSTGFSTKLFKTQGFQPCSMTRGRPWFRFRDKIGLGIGFGFYIGIGIGIGFGIGFGLAILPLAKIALP